MIVVPADTPVTDPEPDPIVATAGLLLAHDWPTGEASVSVVVAPTHSVVVPLIGFIDGSTEIVFVLRHPVPRV